MKFLDIARCVRAVIDAHDYNPNPTLAELLAIDQWARQEAAQWMTRR
jgi:1-deoxy-D-xylulose-5-phosphate reductoisomerase